MHVCMYVWRGCFNAGLVMPWLNRWPHALYRLPLVYSIELWFFTPLLFIQLISLQPTSLPPQILSIFIFLQAVNPCCFKSYDHTPQARYISISWRMGPCFRRLEWNNHCQPSAATKTSFMEINVAIKNSGDGGSAIGWLRLNPKTSSTLLFQYMRLILTQNDCLFAHNRWLCFSSLY